MVYRVVQVLVVFLVTANALPFEDCGSLYDLRNVTIDNCNRVPCLLHPGSIINVTTFFYASFASNFLDNHAVIVISFIENDAKVTTHSCDGATIPCVATSSELLSYSAAMVVDDELPPSPGKLSWRVTNEDSKTLMCFKVDITIALNKVNKNGAFELSSSGNRTGIL